MNYSEFLVDLGKRINHFRLKNKMDESEFADRSGLKVKEVSKIEAGQSDLKIITLFKISNCLGMNISELLAS